VNTRTQSFVLLLFGGALLRLATSDALLRYVRPISRPWVLLAGLAFVGLAGWNLVAALRGAKHNDGIDAHGHGVIDAHGHGVIDAHGHSGASRAGWLVLAPVVAILVIAPPALGAFSASRVPATVAKPAVDISFPALVGRDPVPLSLIDFATRALWDNGRTLTGRKVALTGFVLRDQTGGFVIARLVITCCAADARPIDVGVESGAPAPPADTWVTVTGTYAGAGGSDGTLPLLTSTGVAVIRAPTNPYDD
jgi:uncharacterized repeat protein (TIGR03943 family)